MPLPRMFASAAAIAALVLLFGCDESTDYREPPYWAVLLQGTVLRQDGTPPDPDAYDPHRYWLQFWTQGIRCGDPWEGNGANDLRNADGTWTGGVNFPATVTPWLDGDSVCVRVILNPPPASPWRPDTIDLGGLILRRELPYDTAEAHFVLQPE